MEKYDKQDSLMNFAALLEMGPKLMTTFTDAELRTATGNFSPANKLGQGGFGTVYKVIVIFSQNIV